MIALRLAGAALALLSVTAGTGGAIAAECPRPAPLHFEVTGRIVRSAVGFTQGLEWRDGKLFESTGAIGDHSGLNTIAPDGKVVNLLDQGTKVFGEGLTIIGDEMFQLTWTEHQVFVYGLDGKLKRTMRNPREGWGLTNDGTSLIFSDGGPAFYFADPKTFAITREVKIKSDRGEVLGLNELELVDGKLYGNLFLTNTIVRIDPASGCVEARADLGVLWRAMTPEDKKQVTSSEQNVLNGIAYDSASGNFYLTGKRWRTIFIGKFSAGR
jgi:glutamine cyclotransferase